MPAIVVAVTADVVVVPTGVLAVVDVEDVEDVGAVLGGPVGDTVVPEVGGGASEA
jgi:hypothetical protein